MIISTHTFIMSSDPINSCQSSFGGGATAFSIIVVSLACSGWNYYPGVHRAKIQPRRSDAEQRATTNSSQLGGVFKKVTVTLALLLARQSPRRAAASPEHQRGDLTQEWVALSRETGFNINGCEVSALHFLVCLWLAL